MLLYRSTNLLWAKMIGSTILPKIAMQGQSSPLFTICITPLTRGTTVPPTNRDLSLNCYVDAEFAGLNGHNPNHSADTSTNSCNFIRRGINAASWLLVHHPLLRLWRQQREPFSLLPSSASPIGQSTSLWSGTSFGTIMLAMAIFKITQSDRLTDYFWKHLKAYNSRLVTRHGTAVFVLGGSKNPIRAFMSYILTTSLLPPFMSHWMRGRVEVQQLIAAIVPFSLLCLLFCYWKLSPICLPLLNCDNFCTLLEISSTKTTVVLVSFPSKSSSL